MIKDDNFEKIKEKCLSTQKATNDESVFINLNLSFENEHSVSDLNAKSWFDNVIKEANQIMLLQKSLLIMFMQEQNLCFLIFEVVLKTVSLKKHT